MVDATDAQDERSGVVVTITCRDRLPDLQRFVDDDYANERQRYGRHVAGRNWCSFRPPDRRFLNRAACATP
jgi:hypothetical protein